MRKGFEEKMSTNPLVSVIIPCFNYSRFLEEAVESVLAQSYENIECLIVDDGSTDDTKIVSKRLVDKDTRVKYFYQVNRGLPAARNMGFLESQGKYIQFLDADDLLHPKKIAVQVRLLEDDPKIDVSYTDYLFFASDLNSTQNRSMGLGLSEKPLDDFLFKWERELSIPIHTALFKRSLIEIKVGPFNESLRAKEDWVFWVELAVSGSTFHYLDKQYSYYRKHAQNQTADVKEMCIYFMKAVYAISSSLAPDLQEQFIDESLLHVETAYLGVSHQASLFFDLGDGFNETNRISEILRPERAKESKVCFILNKDLHTKKFRFDPAEGWLCKVWINEIVIESAMGKKEILSKTFITANSCLEKEGYYLFLTTDPQFIIDFPGNIKQVNISFRLEVINHRQIEAEILKSCSNCSNKQGFKISKVTKRFKKIFKKVLKSSLW